VYTIYYGWAYMLTLWGKGGYGGSPNVEAGKGVSTLEAEVVIGGF
jgi:hypothetical protein